MADTFPGQHDDESIDFVFRQHPVVMRKGIVYGFLVFALGLVPYLIWPLQRWTWWVALAGLLVGLIVFGYRFLGWYFSIYIITDERLIQIKQRGFFDRNVQDVSHNRIQSVNYEIKGMQATMLKYGTVVVQTYFGPLELRFIHKPEEVQQHLNKITRNIAPVEPRETGGEDEGRAEEAEE